jgi:hypothetical protein
MNRIILITLLVLSIQGCNAETGDGPVPAKNEIVMSPGMKMTASTSVGTIAVTAGKGLRRSYTWEGDTRSVEMWPRKERWHGSLGLYYPGPGWHWTEHNGIRAGVVQEGQQHFKTLEEAYEWLRNLKGMPYVYRNDGLVVGWTKNLEGAYLSVDVWQVYIDGKKPNSMPGADDDAIVEELGTDP